MEKLYLRAVDPDFRREVAEGRASVEGAADAFMFNGSARVPRLRRGTLEPEQKLALWDWWQTLASAVQKKELGDRLRENFPAVIAIHRAGEKAAQQ